MSRLDLHIHTSASDGTLNPSELIDEVRENGIDVFAVCDHDNIDNLAKTSMLTPTQLMGQGTLSNEFYSRG
jgi:predicted metal-dependent phosphoesterase TrpH